MTVLFASAPPDSGRIRVEDEFAYIPDGLLGQVLDVKGVSRAKPRGNLFRPWF